MSVLVRRLAAIVGTYGSLAALVFTFKQPNAPLSVGQAFLAGIAVVLGLAGVVFEVRDYLTDRPWEKKPSEVADFLHTWIRDGSRVAIFSRNLSWVDQKISEVLSEKAERNDLTLVVPRPIELTDQLKGSGAEVLTYPELEYTIQSRFTIVNLGRSDAKVAIGHALDNGKHRIQKAGAGDPELYLAQDLIELIRRFNGYRGQD
jgi:hypothetical protein